MRVLGRLIRREHSDPIVEELNPGDALEPEGRGTGGSSLLWHSTAWHLLCLRMLHAWLSYLPAPHQRAGAPITQEWPHAFSFHPHPANSALSSTPGMHS